MLRRVLGVQDPNGLSEAVIDSLIEGGVAEGQHLEYKSNLPGPSQDERREFQRDVAAMANSGGGVIILGIVDEGDAASEKAPVPLGAEVTRLRQLIGQIEPFLEAKVHEVQSGSEGRGFVVLEIESPSRRPYAVVEGGRLGYYRRTTRNRMPMSEAEVAESYRQRMEALQRVQDRLAQLRSDLERLPSWNETPVLWIVGSPLQPPGRLFRPDRATQARFQHVEDRRPFSSDRLLDLNPRPGFKRFAFGAAGDVVFEFHDDGSFAGLAPGTSSLATWFGRPAFAEDVPGFTDEHVTSETLTLLASYGRVLAEFGTTGDVVLRYGINPGAVPAHLWTSPSRGDVHTATPLGQAVEAITTVEALDLWPPPATVLTAVPVLDDLMSSFGYPGNFQIDSSGRLVQQFWSRPLWPYVQRWCAEVGVPFLAS